MSDPGNAEEDAGQGDPPRDPLAGRLGVALAAVLVAAVLLPMFWPVWREGVTQVVPAVGGLDSQRFRLSYRSDYRHTIWLTNRNAHALVTEPSAFFDAPFCYPAKRSLAYGEAAVTLGILAIPFHWLAQDPVLAFNALFFSMLVASGCAMFALVRRWTASFPAALASGLCFVLLNERLRDPPHPYIYDLMWLPLALIFAERLFERGKLRDASGLGACVALQMGTTLYPLIASAVIGLCFAGWLCARHGIRHLSPKTLGVIALFIACAAGFVYWPYLEILGSGGLEARGVRYHAHPKSLAPGGLFFPGYWTLALAAVGVLLPLLPGRSEADRARPNPAPVVLLGGVLCLWLALGQYAPSFAPNLFGWLAQNVPGFGAVRAPSKIHLGAQAALAMLAGLGVAQLQSRLHARPALALGVGALCVALVIAQNRVPGFPGMIDPVYYQAERVEPRPGIRELFAKLAAIGDEGPLFELPLIRGGRNPGRVGTVQRIQSEALMAAAYHRRPTTSCLSSNLPPARSALDPIQEGIPSPEAFAELRRLGFRTVVLYEPNLRPNLLARLMAASRGENSELQLLHQAEGIIAWRVTDRASKQSERAAQRGHPS